MMAEEKIREYLKDIFVDYEVVEPNITALTKPGDNFLSTMMKVDVKLKKDVDSKEETLQAVAKCVNNSNEFVNQLFPIAFRNEILFYKEIVPTLQNFQREKGIEDVLDMFPKFYGARFNKNGENDAIDEYAVILLENLKAAGYNNINRHEGFDLEGAKLILKDLATFHATGLCLKLSQTEIFEEKIKNNCRKAIPPPPPPGNNRYEQPLRILFEILEDYQECDSYIPILKQKFSKMREALNEFFDAPAREPFVTLVHCDVWVNNTMQLPKNGKLTKNKFVDFQLVYYQSPVSDVLFFLWSSVQLNILKTSFEDLLCYYQAELLEQIRRLNCNTNMFTLEKFWEEVNASAPTNYMDIMYMTMFVVFGKIDRDAEEDSNDVVKEDVPTSVRDKIAYMVEEYGRRGWI